MTIKIIFERSSQKGGRQGVRKEGQPGTLLEILLSGKKKYRKNSILESPFFLLSSLFSQEIQ